MICEITGIGWVTASGMGSLKDLKAPAMTEGRLPEITSKAIFGPLFQYVRRMDAYSKTGFAAIAFALKDAGLDQWAEKRNIGMIAATETGCLETDIDYYETVKNKENFHPSPTLFSYTLPNTYLGEAAIRFGLTGINFVVYERAPLGLSALRLALESLKFGETDKMLCGFCGLAVPPPFDQMRQSPPGALFFVIETGAVNKKTYANLILDKKGPVTCRGVGIRNLRELMQQCLPV
jgi:3-oxoacyl-[acyl-carrier-protein] synthase II